MEEVTDEPLYRDRVCGIDIGKAGMAVSSEVGRPVRLPCKVSRGVNERCPSQYR